MPITHTSWYEVLSFQSKTILHPSCEGTGEGPACLTSMHIENQGSWGQFGEISCENGFSSLHTILKDMKLFLNISLDLWNNKSEQCYF